MRISILLLLFTCLAYGQQSPSTIYSAYLQKNMVTWKVVMEKMESDYKANPDIALLYDLVEAEYGYVAYCLSVKRKKEAKEVLAKADFYINLLLEREMENPKLYSLQGAFYGYRIFIEPLRALKYRRRSVKANRIAVALGPDEPHAWMEKANIEFFSPAILGGSKKRAVQHYEKAIRLYESSPERIEQNWLYLNCLTGLGLAYEKTGQIREAGAVYRKLLKLEPSFIWVRDDLYPHFLKKHSMN